MLCVVFVTAHILVLHHVVSIKRTLLGCTADCAMSLIPPGVSTLRRVVAWRARQATCHAPHFETVCSKVKASLSDAQLHVAACKVAAHLPPGQPVLLVFDHDCALQFVIAVVACTYAGAIAVPMFAPDSTTQAAMERGASNSFCCCPKRCVCS